MTDAREILRREQEDWEALRSAALGAEDADELKMLKLRADLLKIIHDGERRAHGIGEKAPEQMQAADFLGREQRDAIFRAAMLAVAGTETWGDARGEAGANAPADALADAGADVQPTA